MSRQPFPSGPEFLWKSIALALLLWAIFGGAAWIARNHEAQRIHENSSR